MLLLVLRGTGYGVGWGDHNIGGGGRAEPEAGNIWSIYLPVKASYILYIYIYLEPAVNVLYFGVSERTLQKKGPNSFHSKQGAPFGFQVYYMIIHNYYSHLFSR